MIVRPENPIAVQLYTVREVARDDFPGTLRQLAEGLNALPGLTVDVSGVDTNIVMLDVETERVDPKAFVAGMRERAVQIGAELSLWSEVGAGTEVELRIPGAMAYSAPAGPGTPSPRPARRVFRLRRKQEGGS